MQRTVNPGRAITLALGQTTNGVISTLGSIATYTVDLAPGDRMLVQATDGNPSWYTFDANIHVYGPSGLPVTTTNNEVLLAQYTLRITIADLVPLVTSFSLGNDNPPSQVATQGSVLSLMADRISLAFSEDLLPVSVNDVKNGYDLRAAGANGMFGDADDEKYPLNSPNYSTGPGATYLLANGPMQPGTYRLVVQGLQDVAGNPMAGAFVRDFTVAGVVGYVQEGRPNGSGPSGTSLSSAPSSGSNGTFLVWGDNVVQSTSYFVASGFLGNVDLVVSNSGRSSVSVLLSDGVERFFVTTNISVGGNPIALALGDLNGASELVLVNNGSHLLHVLLAEDPAGSGLRSGFGQGNLVNLNDDDYWSFTGLPAEPNTTDNDWGRCGPQRFTQSGTLRVFSCRDYHSEYRLRVSLARPPLQTKTSVDIGLRSNSHNGIFNTNQIVRLPEGIVGDFYIIAEVYANGQTFEGFLEGDNVTIETNTVHVISAPYADLVVADVVISFPGSVTVTASAKNSTISLNGAAENAAIRLAGLPGVSSMLYPVLARQLSTPGESWSSSADRIGRIQRGQNHGSVSSATLRNDEVSLNRMPRNRFLSIGVDYSNSGGSGFSRLRYAKNDALVISRALESKGFGGAVLINPKSKAEIMDSLISEVMESTPSDSLVLYFSAHGFMDAQDSLGVVVSASPEKTDVITLDELRSVLARYQGESVIIFDNCAEQKQLTIGNRRERISIANKRQPLVLLAASPGQLAYESATLESSYLAHSLAEALMETKDAAGNVDFATLFHSVSRKTIALASSAGKHQIPVVAY